MNKKMMVTSSTAMAASGGFYCTVCEVLPTLSVDTTPCRMTGVTLTPCRMPGVTLHGVVSQDTVPIQGYLAHKKTPPP